MKRQTLLLNMLVGFGACLPLSAQTEMVWSPQGESRNWNLSDSNWTASDVPGAFAAGSDARFDAHPGDVILTEAISAGSVYVDGAFSFKGSGLTVSEYLHVNGALDVSGLSSLNVGYGTYLNDGAVYRVGPEAGVGATLNKFHFEGGQIVFEGGTSGVVYTFDSAYDRIYASKLIDISLEDGASIVFDGSNALTNATTIYANEGMNLVSEGVGNVSFLNNALGDNGGAIYGRQDILISTESGNILFDSNKADYGGAIYTADKYVYNPPSGAAVNIVSGGNVTFQNNVATADGGAIHAGGNVSIDAKGDVVFYNNKSERASGAVIAYGDEGISIKSEGRVVIQKNTSVNEDGAVRAVWGDLVIDAKNGIIVSENSSTESAVGALRTNKHMALTSDANVYFEKNTATSAGAIYASTLDITARGTVFFGKNEATQYYGGAILAVNNVDIKSTEGIVGFRENTSATSGGAIYTTKGDVFVSGYNGVEFSKNETGRIGGGAIFTNAANPDTGNVTVESENGWISFDNNKAFASEARGGAIYSKSGDVSISGNKGVYLHNNEADAFGGAISAEGKVTITSDSGFISIKENTTAGQYANGGAIYAASTVRLEAFKDIVADGNVAAIGSGGAIYSEEDVSIESEGAVTFKNNTAYTYPGGGAISAKGDVDIKAFGDVSFQDNKSFRTHGGAISAMNGDVTIESVDGSVYFERNTAGDNGWGGAILTTKADISAKNNIEFRENSTAGGLGGGIRAVYVDLTTTDGSVIFDSNVAALNGDGGGISASVSLDIVAGKDIIFTNNRGGHGGAICSNDTWPGYLKISTVNGDIRFEDNIAGGYGAGISSWNGSITVNSAGSIEFARNKSGYDGGAIWGNSIDLTAAKGMTFIDNRSGTSGSGGYYNGGAITSRESLSLKSSSGTVLFKDNYTTGRGGAIYMYNQNTSLTLDASLSNITFTGNKQNARFTYLGVLVEGTGSANAIYIDSFSDNYNATVNLIAGEGKFIAFYDPLSGKNTSLATININGTSYADRTIGSVVFSGLNYAADSAEVKSDIAAKTTVWGGGFVLEGNAQYGYAGADMDTLFTLETTSVLWSRNATVGNVLTADTIVIKSGATVSALSGDLKMNGLIDLDSTFGFANIDVSEGRKIEADSFTGGGFLEKKGQGDLNILEVSDMTGTLLISGGTVNVFNADSLADVGMLSLVNDGKLSSNGHSQTFKSLYAFEDSVVDMGGADLTVNEGYVDASLTDVNKLTKTGDASNILTLDGNGAFDDVAEIDIAAGTLELRNIAGTASDKTINVGADSVLDLSLNAANTSNDWTSLNITGSGTVIGANDKVEIDASNMGLQIGDASTPGQNGVYVVVKAENADDVVTLNSNNAYKGTTQVQNGILNVTADSQLGDTALARQVMLDGGNMQIGASFDTLRRIELLQDAIINVVDGVASIWGAIDDRVTTGMTLTKTGGGELGFHLIEVNKVALEDGTLSLNGNTISWVSTLVGSETSALNINAGTMMIYELDTLGDVSIANGATLDIYDSAYVQDITGDGVVSNRGEFTAAGDIEAAAIYNSSGGSFSAKDVTLSDSLTNFDTFSAANVTVANKISNAGEFTVTGDTRASTVVNSGTFNAEKVYADVQNAGEFKFSGIDGDVDNRGVLKLGSDTAFITGHLINRGTVQFVNLDRTLTIGSLGTAGGIFDGGESTFVMDVNSFTGESDRLVITGDASGLHNFILNNVGEGVGDHLMQLDNLIVIQGDASNFTANSSGFDGGAFHYDLVQDSGSAGTFHGKVTGYSDVSQAAVNSIGAVSMGWFSQLDSLVKRMGELRIGSPRQNGEFDFWVRAYGSQTDANLGVQGMSKFREYQWGTDFGGDVVYTSADGNHMTAFGVFMGYQGAKRRFNDRYGSKGETNSGYGGVYATWMHNEGWYSDLVIKGQGFDSSFDSYGTKESGDFKNFAFGASLEVGRQIMDSDGWFIEPSAQFAYMHIFAEDFTMGRTNIDVYNTDSDVYRMQGMVRVGRTLELYGMMFQPYVKAGLEVQFSSAGEVRMVGQTFRPNTDGARGVFGGGIGWQINNASQIYFDFESSIGDKYDRPWAVNLGYRVRF